MKYVKLFGNFINKSINVNEGGFEREEIKESKEYFTPKVIKDKNNPNFIYINIYYPVGSGYLSALGSKTLSGVERKEGSKKALEIGQKIYDKLKTRPEVEDIEVNDLENGTVQIFIVSDNLNSKKLIGNYIN